MKKTMRLTAMLLCAVMLLIGFAAAIEVVDPTEVFYVADYANVLSDETESYIVSKNDSLYSLTGGQIVVVTIEFLGGQNIEEYARTLMNEWKIGSAEFNNGLLLLLVTGEANYWAVQGSGIEISLTASLLGDYLKDYLEPEFAAGNYDAGVMNVFDAFLGWYDRFYSVNVSGGNAGAANGGTDGALTAPGTAEDGTASDSAAKEPADPLETDHTIKKGGIIGKIAGVFLIIVLVLVVLVFAVVAIPRTIYLRRRGYRYGIFNRAFWSHRPPPPPRRPRAPGPGAAPRPPMGTMGMGGAPRTGMGNPPSRPSAHPRPGTSRPSSPRMGGGGSTRGGGAGRSPLGGSRPSRISFDGSRSGSRSSFGGSRSGGPRMGGGGRTRGGGAGR